jgi:virginiamycin B lyase
MRLKTALLATSVLVMAGFAAQAQTLSGQVSSNEEGLMEGVLVSAKKEGSTITTTVVTNEKGQFSFPAGKLEPGKYNLTIRAVGYTLTGPKSVEVAASGATAELKLGKARNLASQLSNGEWMLSVPGSDDFKKSFMLDCQGCHTLQRVFTALHDAEEWKQVFTRMGRYAPESTPAHPQLIVQGGLRSERPRVAPNMMQQAAEYLEKVSQANPDRIEYDFKTLPRPKGKATKVVITEFDLPRKEAQPHDVVVDADGHAWYTDFGNQVVGELDPKTGKVSDYKLELLRPDQPKGSPCRTRAARRRSTARPSRSRPIRSTRNGSTSPPRPTWSRRPTCTSTTRCG